MACPVLLCVDDRPEALDIRKSCLELMGYSVLGATSSLEALAILEQMPVDAVLMQYKAEGLDAEAVARHVKQRFPDKPIILLSAYSDMPQRILWLVDEYLMRSEYPERLGDAVQRVTALGRKLPPESDRLASHRHHHGHLADA